VDFTQSPKDPTFTGNDLFMDKLNFTETEITKIHNNHVLSDENGHVIQSHHQQQQFSIKVWVGILGDCIIRPSHLTVTS
jgi:hypothetical protein